MIDDQHGEQTKYRYGACDRSGSTESALRSTLTFEITCVHWTRRRFPGLNKSPSIRKVPMSTAPSEGMPARSLSQEQMLIPPVAGF
jgi:hypothetical protein